MEKITIYHSPDADDAFMFYGLSEGKISTEGFTFEHKLGDIESLNQLALKGEVDCTAVSVHAFAYLADKYAILNCGASMGDKNYGPRVLSAKPLEFTPGKKVKVALPGKLTSAALAMKLFLESEHVEGEFVYVHFDEIEDAIKRGEVDCGVIIHEGQLTFERQKLMIDVDLGAWWWRMHHLPLPLGINIVKKDLSVEAKKALASAVRQSIDYGLAHREEALTYALTYGRGITMAEADKFVGMYVNHRTLSLGGEEKKSIKIFLEEGVGKGIVHTVPVIEYVGG